MIARLTGGIVLVGTAAFLLLLGALHVLRRDLDPSWRVISEYAVGRHGWLMALAFLVLAAISAALATASWVAGTRRLGRIGAFLLVVTTVGMTMAGLFTTDLITVPAAGRTTIGRLHEVGALLDLTPFAAILVSLALLRGATAPLAARRTLLAAMAAPMIGLVVFAAATASQMPANGVGSPEALIGWPNRLLIASYCVWHAAAGWYLWASATRSSRPVPGNEPGGGRTAHA